MSAFCTTYVIFLLILTMVFIGKPTMLFDQDGSPRIANLNNPVTIGTMLYTLMVFSFMLLTYIEYAVRRC